MRDRAERLDYLIAVALLTILSRLLYRARMLRNWDVGLGRTPVHSAGYALVRAR
jgi:hypothetical protein